MIDLLTGSVDLVAAVVFAGTLSVMLLLMAALAPSGDSRRRLRRRIEQARGMGRAGLQLPIRFVVPSQGS